MDYPTSGLFKLKNNTTALPANPAPEPQESGDSFADRVLRKLGLLSSTADNLVTGTDPSTADRIQRTMRQAGFRAGGQHNGTPHGLEVNLVRILANLHEQFDQNDRQQSNLRQHKQAEVDAVTNEIEHRQEERASVEYKLTEPKATISELKAEINLLRTDPEKMHLQEPSRLALWISGIILAFLTVYLFVFYSSAIYSAFFKQFTGDDDTVGNSIFDGQAVVKAWHEGFLEVVLIATLPAAFLGLGYIIHQIMKSKESGRGLKLSALVGITFVFDFILAYGITKKIYDLKKDASVKDMADYHLLDAVINVDFWTIIFAGFVVYIIWGVLFDFFMESHRQSNKVGTAITEREKQIQEKQAECTVLEEQIGRLREAIRALISQRLKLEAQKGGILIPALEWANYLMEFCDGWLAWMSGADISLNKQNQCKTTLDGFIERHLGESSVLTYRPTEIGALGIEGAA